MTKKEREEFIKLLKKKQEELANDKEASIKFLIRVGIIDDKHHELTKPYKDLCIPQNQG